MEAIPQADEHEQRKHLVLKLVDLCETERQKGFYLSNLIEKQNLHSFFSKNFIDNYVFILQAGSAYLPS